MTNYRLNDIKEMLMKIKRYRDLIAEDFSLKIETEIKTEKKEESMDGSWQKHVLNTYTNVATLAKVFLSDNEKKKTIVLFIMRQTCAIRIEGRSYVANDLETAVALFCAAEATTGEKNIDGIIKDMIKKAEKLKEIGTLRRG